MKPELASAINFILGHLYNKLPRRRVDIFAEELEKAMEMKFAGHWYPGYPNKGSGYRCMRVSQTLLDPAIAIAINESGLQLDDIVGNLPEDLMVWVDPGEVSYRAGEKGIVTIIYREKNMEPRASPESITAQDASDTSSISPTGSSIPSPVTVLEPLEIVLNMPQHQPQHHHQQQGSPQQAQMSTQPSQLSPQQPQMHHAPPQLVAPIPLLPMQHQSLPLPPGPIGNPTQQQLLQAQQEFNYNPDAKEFLPMDNLPSSLGSMQIGSPGSSTPLGYPPMSQLGFHPIAPMPQKPRPVSAPNAVRPSSFTFTAASFAQTKFGSTKLKSSGKRVNFQQLSPTEFANYMKQRSAMKSFRGQRSPVNSRGDFSTIQTSKDDTINGWLDHSMPQHQQTSPAALSPEPQQNSADPFANNGWMFYDGWSTTSEQYTPNSLIAAN